MGGRVGLLRVREGPFDNAGCASPILFIVSTMASRFLRTAGATSAIVRSTTTSPTMRKHLRPLSSGFSASITSPCSVRSMSSSLIFRVSSWQTWFSACSRACASSGLRFSSTSGAATVPVASSVADIFSAVRRW